MFILGRKEKEKQKECLGRKERFGGTEKIRPGSWGQWCSGSPPSSCVLFDSGPRGSRWISFFRLALGTGLGFSCQEMHMRCPAPCTLGCREIGARAGLSPVP